MAASTTATVTTAAPLSGIFRVGMAKLSPDYSSAECSQNRQTFEWVRAVTVQSISFTKKMN